MARTGLMGGTFDPIHLGHLLAAEAAREAADLDEVWFIPTNVPPHKAQPGADAQARLEMVKLAIADHPAFRAEDAELVRGGVSYTVDTVAALREHHPDRSFYWIVGTDMMNDLPNWRRIEELAAQVRFVCLRRQGEDSEASALPAYLRDNILQAPMPPIGISSTAIRDRLREGRSIRYQVPDAVRDYIGRNGLYES
ncbi:nicotinate-nucleotide adenylyltransferase [Cohnella lubricantis]|uniref:Probable nicotinate-nucleotide adenylyltransferase n=1 Tax=Cohnella lubricantis TaxID=2163172 RepID=A0A841T2I0_9BACL|nr:nicotinate-nucleotide adenylyltransferase [Cohnella lubricantis]MBB6675783.1 nicotinate-nucleotide adenylyltransferase [Cohnella lubricantis]MBP2119858.1 nicotinate-nucleotide adenylyltransferase [Cohnella lubricantis]